MESLGTAMKDLLAREDPRNPWTDEELAHQLGQSRSTITLTRKRLGLPDSRERMRPELLAAMQQTLSASPGLSDRELTEQLTAAGFRISRFTVGRLRESLPAGTPDGAGQPESEPSAGSFSPPELPKKPAGSDPFQELVGADGSLRLAIQQAKAAVLYPPVGLHCLILGPTGTGKSQLADAMHRFTILQKQADLPFVVFNCADYAENPQLLLSQLFGHVRGAFTGADVDKPGLVDQADGGILFLDEVHRLVPEGQELLFHLMDRGRYRRLGETGLERRATVMIVAATTENPESALLTTFRRRIPMVIELPALTTRPLQERLRMIQLFLRQEAHRIGMPIRLRAEVTQAFLLYDPSGNVGQVKSDLQVACARGFLTSITSGIAEVTLGVADLTRSVRGGLLRLPERRSECETLGDLELTAFPGSEPAPVIRSDSYTLPQEIYQFIEVRHRNLQESDLTESEINQVVAAETESRIRQYVQQLRQHWLGSSSVDLAGVVGSEVLEVARQMVDLARPDWPLQDDRLLYCLALHLRGAVDRIRHGRPAVYPQLPDIDQRYPREYETAARMVSLASERLALSLPENEVGLVATYLHNTLQLPEARMGIVVMTHGQVASNLNTVAARLLGGHHARWFEMSMDESPEVALPRAAQVVVQANEGRGALLLVDMGSLLSFGEWITARTGIQTRVVDRVDILMLMEAIRWAQLPGVTLDEAARAIHASRTVSALTPHSAELRTVVVTLCLTGHGAALQLRSLLKRVLASDAVEIIAVGAISPADVRSQLDQLSLSARVAAVVGTLDPQHPTIPFIPVETLSEPRSLEQIRTRVRPRKGMALPELLRENLIVTHLNAASRTEVIDRLGRLLLEAGYVTESFLTDTFRRELIGPTVLAEKVALPHGEPRGVCEPAIAVATLAEPVDWGGQPADVVFLLALTSQEKEAVERLWGAIRSPARLGRLRRASTWTELKEALLS